MLLLLQPMQVYGAINWRYGAFHLYKPFRIKVTGRTKHHINVFGEELIIENAETALKQASKHTQCEILDYTAAPIFMEGREKGAHEWIIEFKTPPKRSITIYKEPR